MISLHLHPKLIIINLQRWLFLSFIYSASFLFSLSLSDPRITQSGLYCGSKKSTINIPTFVKEMETLSQHITTSHFATSNLNYSSTSTLYALAQCHQDLSQTDCLLCYAASRTKLPRCLPSLSARIYLDGCFLRYDNYSFYQESISSSFDTFNCGDEYFGVDDDGNNLEFFTGVGDAVGNVTIQAVENGGFAAVKVSGIYALAQCWDSVGREGCRGCLEMAGKAARGCVPKKEGRGMNAGCYLRYSTDKFYKNGGGEKGNAHGLGITIAIVLATAACLMLSFSAVYAICVWLLKAKQERNNLGKVPISFKKSSLSFKYEILEKATDFFSPSRKLGQGGAGSVFIGTLPNGETVAVKRLIFNTKQWVDEFFNEVNLISGIQHKNLVKLLGCSIEGPESLLVYEYAPNKSLDQFLFDKTKRTLNWKQRFEIILGTAEGLAYLHEGSQVRIIHRDIKSSNVLLDDNLTPKIADFGLVRCLGADISHLSTGIAGTVGYMAPEYLIRGKLTDKADVYSFGVLVLEILGGKRCNAIMENSGSLLQTVWQLYRSNRLVDAVDPCLRDEFPSQEASCVLQIGLLCTQASAALRPSMAQVVHFLTNNDCEIPTPNQPPYLNTSLLKTENSRRSYSINSLVSNGPSEIEASSTSLESSSMHSSDGQTRSEESNARAASFPSKIPTTSHTTWR